MHHSIACVAAPCIWPSGTRNTTPPTFFSTLPGGEPLDSPPVDDPRTHYQLSFTSTQALAVFLVVLGALAGAYFFGLMTGLAGREPANAAVPTPVAVEAAEESFPTPVLGINPGAARPREAPPAAGAPGAASPSTVQLFEDRGEGERTVPTAPPAPAASGTTGGFWVQVVSLSSESEARARTARLVRRGYPAVVVPGPASGRGSVYRVRVGPFERREDAARAAARLSTEEKTETWIVPSGR
jgi:sporulation related protein